MPYGSPSSSPGQAIDDRFDEGRRRRCASRGCRHTQTGAITSSANALSRNGLSMSSATKVAYSGSSRSNATDSGTVSEHEWRRAHSRRNRRGAPGRPRPRYARRGQSIPEPLPSRAHPRSGQHRLQLHAESPRFAPIDQRCTRAVPPLRATRPRRSLAIVTSPGKGWSGSVSPVPSPNEATALRRLTRKHAIDQAGRESVAAADAVEHVELKRRAHACACLRPTTPPPSRAEFVYMHRARSSRRS